MRANPTEAESRLWAVLRNKRLASHKFKRQQVIGRFIVDFVNFEQRLIVEADGSQHIASERDYQRTLWLEHQGFRVLRFWNDDILARTEQVAEAIWSALTDGASPLSPNPSPTRGEGPLNGAFRV
ncbi:very-short-patch-repair endonuclease [Sphingobium sp. B11D3B]|uniref:endonuclease domain-containing protein n=1 Tax=Sphingobium sp. B11D3B TaxID=2940575 RepID=UPI002226BC68|nr:endonuclease domain-containing protein [Sphingobium sp. B11D3B]MCW2389414.1 very-short-patch-repair endonuclease [Sphingobium sp. B11D3B]